MTTSTIVLISCIRDFLLGTQTVATQLGLKTLAQGFCNNIFPSYEGLN